MDERKRRELWQAIYDYADQRTIASRLVVERVVSDIEAQSSLVPNANGDVLPRIEFEVVTVKVDEAQLREAPMTIPERLSERFMRQVDAKILAEIEQTVADLPKLDDLA